MPKRKYKRGSRIYTIQELLERLSKDGVVIMHFFHRDKVQNREWLMNMGFGVIVGMLKYGRFYAVEPNENIRRESIKDERSNKIHS